MLKVLDVLFVRRVPGSGEIETRPGMPGRPTLVSQADVDEVAGSLEPGQAAGLLLIEHLWARQLADAVADDRRRDPAAGRARSRTGPGPGEVSMSDGVRSSRPGPQLVALPRRRARLVVAGVLAIVYPDITLLALGIFIGIGLLFSGAMDIAEAIGGDAGVARRWPRSSACCRWSPA